jgi:hypothetical protein
VVLRKNCDENSFPFNPTRHQGRAFLLRGHAQAVQRKRREAERAHEVNQKEIAQQAAREEAIKGFWQSHSDDERQRMEAEALSVGHLAVRLRAGRRCIPPRPDALVLALCPAVEESD